jgi:hypothetical protein
MLLLIVLDHQHMHCLCIIIIAWNVVAEVWSHRDRPLSTGAPLGDHCVPVNDVQEGVIFRYSRIVSVI